VTVIITRPEPAASATAEKLRKSGFDVIVSPVLEIVDTGAAQPPGNFAGLIITSANALDIAQRREGIEKLLDLPVFVVGDATAQKARVLGFKNVISASGDAEKLAVVILDHFASSALAGINLLYACGADITPGLVATLKKNGLKVTSWVLYQAVLVKQLTKETSNILQAGQTASVVLYSARTARQFGKLASSFISEYALDNITFYAISEKVKAALPDAWQARCFCAPHPDENSLFTLIRERMNK